MNIPENMKEITDLASQLVNPILPQMEDFVTLEITKKLKEKGFPIKTKTEGKFGLTKVKEVEILPTISQVLKWLREEKDIDLVISPVFFYDDVLGKMREYGCKVFAPSLNKPEHCGYYEEWEQAAIAGIEYILYNLI